MLKRRNFIETIGAASVLGGVAPIEARAAGRAEKNPNILFVFADQLRSMELGCYGGRQVRTPNMDRLAREGVLFGNAYST